MIDFDGHGELRGEEHVQPRYFIGDSEYYNGKACTEEALEKIADDSDFSSILSPKCNMRKYLNFSRLDERLSKYYTEERNQSVNQGDSKESTGSAKRRRKGELLPSIVWVRVLV